jgi:amino acid adenylation domain-containing protein
MESDTRVLAFPASPAQEAFFYLERLFPVFPAFNVPVRFRLDGVLDIALLHRAFEALADRHEGMRTRFVEEEGHLLQVVEPQTTVDFPVTDLSHLEGPALDAEIDRLGSIEARQHFDLSKDPLFRASILICAPDRHILQITIHHAVADGWSIGIMTDDLAEFYNSALEDRAPALEPLAIQYADFTIWQREFLESEEIKPHLDYWKNHLHDYVELALPTDRPRPSTKSWDGDIVSRILPASLSERVARLAREQGATMFHVFLAAFKAVASRYAGIDDIAVGTPVAGRTRAELEPIVGTFINSVILRTDLSGDPSFREVVSRVRDTATDAIAHQDLPFEQLVKALHPRRDPGRNPLFQVNFTHQRDFVRPVSFGGARLTAFPSRSPGAIFDLHFFMVERADGWRASCDYACDLFDRDTALSLLAHFETLLDAATTDADLPVSKLPLLTRGETQTLHDWAGKKIPYPADANLGELFLAQARLHPGRTAVRYQGNSTSYAALATAALETASRLIEAGVKPGDRVPLCAPSVPEMIAAQLGIVLSGAACIPLDPEYPADRLRYMLTDSGAKVLLATPALATRFFASGAEVLELRPIPSEQPATIGSAPVPDIPATAVSHIFYTSGSTGTPKGVLVPHRGITRLALGGGFMEFGPEDSFLQAAPISFDAATLEIWMPLLNGGHVVLSGEGGNSLESIARALREEKVTCLWLTAGLFQTMVDEHLDDLRGLKYLLAGGDVLSPQHVRRAGEALTQTTLINGYGPTENTTFTCCHRITRDDTGASIPIGRPIGNTTVHILDPRLRPVPRGIPGELFTGGDGLAVGYLNQPELTAEKFITLPSGERLYRTGDQCRWRADGVVEFLGRLDHQVKVRGFRIETGEIEATLARHPHVAQTRATVRGADAVSKKLLAWVTLAPGHSVTSSELRDFLGEHLPAYMVPVSIGILDRFPLNANGKVDLAALPDPSAPAGASSQPPQTDSEIRLAALWSELLERPEISRNDDWFDLGGHSLLALRLFSRIHREFGLSLPLSTLLNHPTVRSLAVFLDSPAVETAPLDEAAVVVTLNEGPGIALFGVHGGDGATLFYRELAARIPGHTFHALESRQLSHSGPIEVLSIEATATAYLRSLKRVQPTGPYALAGYSFGGLVAWEMACQLIRGGDEVSFLALFDTINPAAPTRNLSAVERLNTFWSQHDDVSAPKRLGMLASRFIEGTRTHLRVRREQSDAASSAPAEAHTDLRRIRLREEHYRSMLDYQPGGFSGVPHLLKVRFPGDQLEIPADYGWGKLSGGRLVTHEIPGQHLTIFEPENVPALAQIIGAELDRLRP